MSEETTISEEQASVTGSPAESVAKARGRRTNAASASAEATDWILEDGQWKEVPASSVSITSEPRDRADPFALPAECNQGDGQKFDYLHGSDNPQIMQSLQSQGWVVCKEDYKGAAIKKNGGSYFLGSDAPLMKRPFAVASRYAPTPTEELLSKERESARDRMGDILKDWRKEDRTIDPSPDALLSAQDRIELLREQGGGDPTAGARLRAERQALGFSHLDSVPQERVDRRQAPSFTMPWTDEQFARYRASRRKATV